MGSDNLTQSAVSDGNQHVSIGDSQGDPLARLQQAAGLQDSLLPQKTGDGLVEAAKHIWEGITSKPGIIDHWESETTPPSDKERGDAEKTLEGRMSKLIPEADREAMKAMTTAITNGDTKAFAEAVKKAGGDPQKLKALVTEVDKMLEDKNCSMRLDVTADGKVLVSDTAKSTALAFDPKTGNIEARSVEQNLDGSVMVKPGELLHVDTDKVFKDMGDSAVNSVNGKIDFSTIKNDPFEKPEPWWPHGPVERPFPGIKEMPQHPPKTWNYNPEIELYGKDLKMRDKP